MPESWPHLQEAATDFRFLLARGYPRKVALGLVGNQYNLSTPPAGSCTGGLCPGGCGFPPGQAAAAAGCGSTVYAFLAISLTYNNFI